MPKRFEGSRVRSSRLPSIAFTELGGVVTSQPMQRRRSVPRFSDILRRFRIRRSVNKRRKSLWSPSIRSSMRGGRPVFLALVPGSLATPNGIAIPDFSAVSAPPLSEPDNDFHHRHRPHLPTVPGRGGRAAAPDGAFGLFGNRYFPARVDFERVGRL